MFDIRKSFGYDQKLAESGTKMMVGADSEDYFLVRMIPNSAYTSELEKVMRANHKILNYLKTSDPAEYKKLDRKLQSEVMGKTVVVGWGKGIVVDGKRVKYSPEAAAKLLVDFPALRGDVIDFATDLSNYPEEVVINKEEIKKS